MNKKLTFIAGPCVIESEELVRSIAENLKDITSKYDLNFIFKASFDKANRTSIDSFRGPGIDEGLAILKRIKQDFNFPILSDIHCVTQVDQASEVLDIIQIPAFLCRQTDLILAVAKTMKTINIKKAQFLSAEDVRYVVKKVESVNNKNILLTERGTCFGYNNLVVDFRSFSIMAELGYPIIFDVTHSVQIPSLGGVSKGNSEFIGPLACAAVAYGVDGLFCEVHPDPRNALSDAANSLRLDKVEPLLKKVLAIREIILNSE